MPAILRPFNLATVLCLIAFLVTLGLLLLPVGRSGGFEFADRGFRWRLGLDGNNVVIDNAPQVRAWVAASDAHRQRLADQLRPLDEALAVLPPWRDRSAEDRAEHQRLQRQRSALIDASRAARPPAVGREVRCQIGLGLIAAACLVIPVARQTVEVRADRRRRRWKAAGCCPHCGYDLRGSGAKCPECGRWP